MSKKIKERQPSENEKHLLKYLKYTTGVYAEECNTTIIELLNVLANLYMDALVASHIPKDKVKEILDFLLSQYPEVEEKND